MPSAKETPPPPPMSAPISTRDLAGQGGSGPAPQSASPPLIGLLDHPQVDERLRVTHAVDHPKLVCEEREQGLVVLADGLDQEVVRSGGDHDVVDLWELCDGVCDALQ